MPDLNERLRGVDRVPVPELWGDVHERAVRDVVPGTGTGSHRFLTAILALALAGSAIAALIWAFHGNGGTPLSSGPRPNGAIATLERGDAGALGVENVDIVAIDPSTGARIDLSPGPDAESHSVWSPDGTRVAFLRTSASDDGQITLHKGLFVMNADGSGAQEVYQCASADQCEVQDFAWSPDDRHLAWTIERRHQEGGAVLQILNLTTGEIAVACALDSCGQSLVQLAWSPDGSRLAFTDAAVLPGMGGPPASSIWLVDPDGADLTRLTKGRACYFEQGPTNCFADTWPAWSPDGRTLVFLHYDIGGRGSIGVTTLIRTAPDGSDRREISLCGDTTECQPSAPVWSPDGTSILFVSGYDESARINLLDPTSGAVTDVTAVGAPDCVRPVGASWSPDGNLVAFIGGPSRLANLCTVPREGGSARVLIAGFRGYYLSSGLGFTWLPEGAVDMSSATSSNSPSSEPGVGELPPGTIVFTSSNGSNDEEDGLEIWSMSSDGSDPTQLTSNDVTDMSPALSPDGTRVAFGRSGRVWVMDIDGSNAQPLSTGMDARSPVWSPDGTQIAFSSSGGHLGADGIYVMEADGSGVHLVAPGDTFGHSWRPDGNAITYSLNTSDGRLHLQTVELPSNDVHPFFVPDLPGYQDFPVWSPDGSTLAFAWSTAGGSGLYLANADGSNLRRVVGAPFTAGDSGLGITWAPDGTWLAFEGLDDRYGPQIYAIRADGTGLRRLTDLPGFMTGTSLYAITGNPTWGP